MKPLVTFNDNFEESLTLVKRNPMKPEKEKDTQSFLIFLKPQYVKWFNILNNKSEERSDLTEEDSNSNHGLEEVGRSDLEDIVDASTKNEELQAKVENFYQMRCFLKKMLMRK